MANTKSAKRSIAICQRYQARNRHHRSTMRTAIKRFLALLDGAQSNEELLSALQQAQKAIGQAASKGAIKKQTGARKTSRLYRRFHDKFNQPPSRETVQPSG